MDNLAMHVEYQQNGYLVVKSLFKEKELSALKLILKAFHRSWIHDNFSHYNQRAVNSAYLTGTRHLNTAQRKVLFQFIASHKISSIAQKLLPLGVAFMNSQLFFNPQTPQQKNYWHRDIQYSLMSIAEQQIALTTNNVLHFRIPLLDEPGIELIPGTHSRWDSEKEFNVRMEREGHNNYANLQNTNVVPLHAGDLLVFSANMIHRGIYGKKRFALDLLFCDPDPELLRYVDKDCLPDKDILQTLACAQAFTNTIKFIA
jgi:ectoine hydroxylase-related dioxygenase (phytanoyl-CoA dioxygenase family)